VRNGVLWWEKRRFARILLISPMRRKTGGLSYYYDLITVLTYKEIKVKYKNSVLGYLWSLAYPLGFAFVFFIAFKVVMRVPMKDYALFLVSGLFPWQWFSNSVCFSSTAFLANSSLIKKTSFPRSFLPLVTVLNDMIHFILSIPVVALFLFLYGRSPSFSWLYGIPILLFLQLLLTYGISLAGSSINLFFRDLERLINIFTMFIFYFTPIIYSEDMIPEKYRNLLALNPVAPLMVSWRSLFLKGTLDRELVFHSLMYGTLFFLFGYAVYKKLSYRFAEAL
jgi:lipopolysaccharide transport system permease protein